MPVHISQTYIPRFSLSLNTDERALPPFFSRLPGIIGAGIAFGCIAYAS